MQILLSSPFEILVHFLPFVERKVTRSGVQVHCLTYWHPDMAALVGRRRVKVYFDPRDILIVYLRGSDDQLIKAEVRETVRRMSHWEWDRLRAELAKAWDPAKHAEAMTVGVETADAIAKQSKAKTRKARKTAAREKEHHRGADRVHRTTPQKHCEPPARKAPAAGFDPTKAPEPMSVDIFDN